MAALAATLALGLSSQGSAGRTQVIPGIVNGPALRLAGTHTFSFNPSGAGGTIIWSVDRETISEAGVHTRTKGILSRTGPTATISLPAVGNSETIYYLNAADAGIGDVDTVQVLAANTKTWFTHRSAGNPDVRRSPARPDQRSAFAPIP